MDERNNIYYLEVYVPSWLARDAGYADALRTRLVALIEKDEYDVLQVGEPFVKETPDVPAQPGMVTLRTEALVREYDVVIPFEDDGVDVGTVFDPPKST